MIRTIFFSALMLISACDEQPESVVQQQTPVKDSVVSIPLFDRFVDLDYVDLNSIERISKFRSGIGHDYHDEAESCRSMKHYYQPKSNILWSNVTITAPVNGIVVRTMEEWAGTQLWIQPLSYPAYTIILFHIALNNPVAIGDTLRAGTKLGTHIGSQTMSDVAVGYQSQNQWQLISYFEIITDSLFLHYRARGITSRNDLIISKSARDADPLGCSGGDFGTTGTLENWVVLK